MKFFRNIVQAMMVALIFLCIEGSAQQLPAEIVAYPDMVLHNGQILTADDAFTITQAVAIRDGKVLAVGDNGRIRAMVGPKTQVIDLQGKTVTPGFIDPHFHLHNYSFNRYVNGGIDIYPVILIGDLEGEETKESFLRALRKRARETTPRDGWIILGDARGEDHGVIENTLLPALNQGDVDEVFPADLPAAVGTSHGNNFGGYVVNSAGMKIVEKRMPSNIAGVLTDPQTGKPTGKLTGDAARYFGTVIAPWPDMKLVMQALEKAIPMYTREGITLIQTKTPGYVVQALREFWWRGEMPIRWRAQIEVGADVEAGYRYLGNLTDLGDPWFRITSGPGGVPRPFWDSTYQEPRPAPGNRGRGWKPPAERQAELDREGPSATFLSAKYGWSLTNVHNKGDLSTDAFMNEIEKGLKERVMEAYGQRFNIDHSLMVTKQTPQGNQFERMKKLGIIPSLKSNYLLDPIPVGSDPNKPVQITEMDMLVAEYGKERVFQMLPARSLIDYGIKPASESDRWYLPVSTPLWAMEKLVTRKDDHYKIVWGESERVSRKEALWMRTNWAARYFGLEAKELGTLEPGKLADLVVLGQDYLTVPEDDISEIPVVMTIIGGKIIYDANRDHVERAVLPPGITITE